MSESIWKKEIRFGKPKAPKAPEPPKAENAEKTSIWKKELSLGGSKQPKAPKVPEPPKAEKAEKTSIWKKELSLGGSKQPKPPKQKKLKKQPPAVSPSVQAAEQAHAPAPAPAQLPRLAEAHQRPRGTVVVPVVPAQSAAVARLQRWSERVPASHTQSPRPAAQPPAAQPPAAQPPAAAATPAPLPTPEPAPVMPLAYTRTTERAPQPAAPVVEEPVAVVAPPEPEPVVQAPEPVAQEKVPLLKREISFGRKNKQPKQPKAAKEPKQKKQPKVKAEKAPKAPKPPKEERVSLLKREISLGRKPKAAKAPKGEKPAKAAKAAGGHKASRVVGLRIGSSQIAAATVSNNGSHQVLQLAQTSIERGLIVGGEVREPVALTKELKAFFAANKLPRKDIRLGVAGNRIGVRVLEVPAVDDVKQFENAIRFRAQEALPIPVADAVLDHVILGEEPDADGTVQRRVLLVFAHRELVSRYVDVCRAAGLRLTGIDLDAFALLRATVPARAEGDARASVAVFVGHERTVFAVADGDVCDFTRVLEWGMGNLDVAIARALNLTPSQAEPIRLVLDLDGTEPPAEISPMQYEAAKAAAKAEIGQLVRELLSSLRFYQSRPGTPDIAELVLSGSAVGLAGFVAEVQRSLGAPVRVGDPFANVTLAKKLAEPDDPGSLAIAVGLGIEA